MGQAALCHGALKCGVAAADHVDDGGQFDAWIGRGDHAGMAYMTARRAMRDDPRLLLPGCRSIACLAFPCHTPERPAHVNVAEFALGGDYHKVLRRELKAVAREVLGTRASWRVCVDSAPLRERWWGARAGVGFVAGNGLLMVPGMGTRFLLGFVLTDAEIAADEPSQGDCGRCGRCRWACPMGALRPDGSVDASRCLSYLTIEHRGPLPRNTDLHGCLYGCDICQDVCPRNDRSPLTTASGLMPRHEMLALTLETAAVTHDDALRHGGESLRRNAQALLAQYKAQPSVKK